MIKSKTLVIFALICFTGLALAGDRAQMADLPAGTVVKTTPAVPAPPFTEDVIYLDADTPETGSLLETEVLDTPYGPISSPAVEIWAVSDPDMLAVGAAGDGFDIIAAPDSYAILEFGFDVSEITFIYGGNSGSILIEARDASGVVVDSFYQADTYDGQPAGPATLAGSGIRSLYWEDPGNNYGILDNLVVTVEGGVATEASTWGQIKAIFR